LIDNFLFVIFLLFLSLFLVFLCFHFVVMYILLFCYATIGTTYNIDDFSFYETSHFFLSGFSFWNNFHVNYTFLFISSIFTLTGFSIRNFFKYEKCLFYITTQNFRFSLVSLCQLYGFIRSANQFSFCFREELWQSVFLAIQCFADRWPDVSASVEQFNSIAKIEQTNYCCITFRTIP
jgi:hypothetical protein